MKTSKQVRVRFAPSPTGEVHIGSARTALFNYLFTKHQTGKIILRVEDTDQKRFVPGSVERLMENMKWLGIEFDESPSKGGSFGPYTQSERLGIYQEYAQKLIEDGHAYYCFCSEDKLTKMRERQIKNKQAPMYDKTCQHLHGDEIKEKVDQGKKFVIRLKVPDGGKTVFEDLVRGHIEIDNYTVDDQILIKSDGMPTYHLAVVVDDYLMKISHVLRGEEWLPSTPKQLLLYNAFGWTSPQFGHLPTILGNDKKKLSKREGSVSVEEFRKLGYLPEAIINFIVLIGWNPKNNRELFTLTELENEFDIKNVNKSGGIFDRDKLDHFNQYYIKHLSNNNLINAIFNFQFSTCLPVGKVFNQKKKIPISKIDKKLLDKIITVIKDRMVKLCDFEELAKPFLEEIKYDPKLIIFKKSTKESTLKGLQDTRYKIQDTNDSNWESIDKLNQLLLDIVNDGNLTNGDVFWPVRVALSGLEKSPSPVELLWVLGKEESIKRLDKAIKILS